MITCKLNKYVQFKLTKSAPISSIQLFPTTFNFSICLKGTKLHFLQHFDNIRFDAEKAVFPTFVSPRDKWIWFLNTIYNSEHSVRRQRIRIAPW